MIYYGGSDMLNDQLELPNFPYLLLKTYIDHVIKQMWENHKTLADIPSLRYTYIKLDVYTLPLPEVKPQCAFSLVSKMNLYSFNFIRGSTSST